MTESMSFALPFTALVPGDGVLALLREAAGMISVVTLLAAAGAAVARARRR